MRLAQWQTKNITDKNISLLIRKASTCSHGTHLIKHLITSQVMQYSHIKSNCIINASSKQTLSDKAETIVFCRSAKATPVNRVCWVLYTGAVLSDIGPLQNWALILLPNTQELKCSGNNSGHYSSVIDSHFRRYTE